MTKLNPTGTAILWSTYVGGGKADGSDSVFWTGPVQLDGNGNVYITGQIRTTFPIINPLEPTPTSGSMQVLVAELDPTGANLLFSTMIGSKGLNTAQPAGLAVDTAGGIYLAGNTNGPDLITTPGAFQTTSSDGACCQKGNGFVVKIAPTAAPALQPGSLANGATYVAGGLVPGSWAQVKGTNLSTTTRIWAASDFTGLGNSLPTNLSGVQVNVNNQAAAVYYISPTQVSFQVPAGITGTATVEVITNGVVSNSVTAAAATNSPGIFPVILGGTNYAAAVFLDGKIAADPSNGPAFRNAVPGDTVQLFATGLVPSPAGTLVSTTLLSGVTVTIGTVTIPAIAAALVAVGEFQINFTVPQEFCLDVARLVPHHDFHQRGYVAGEYQFLAARSGSDSDHALSRVCEDMPIRIRALALDREASADDSSKRSRGVSFDEEGGVAPTPRSPAYLKSIEVVGEFLAPFEITIKTTPFAREYGDLTRKIAECLRPAATLYRIDMGGIDQVWDVERHTAQIVRPVGAGDKDQSIGIDVTNGRDQLACPWLPFRHCYAIEFDRIRRTVLTIEWIRVIG